MHGMTNVKTSVLSGGARAGLLVAPLITLSMLDGNKHATFGVQITEYIGLAREIAKLKITCLALLNSVHSVF